MDQVRAAAGVNKKKDTEEAPKKPKMKNGERIPKKLKNDSGKSVPSPKRLCQLCAVHAPKIKNTHNTSDCFKFNPDGSRKAGSSGARNANVHTSEQGELLKIFAHMQKEQKQLKKMLSKNKKKKRKRSRKYIDSSDDDSDSSDDE